MDDGLEVDVLDELRKEYTNTQDGGAVNEQRYVTFHACGKHATIADGQRQGDCPEGYCKVFTLGPEVKEPDYGPLAEWLSDDVRLHRSHCKAFSTRPVARISESCTCGLSPALKAAGL